MKTFDRRFAEVFRSIPASPGVYRFFNAAGELVYVGKAKNLRRRLGQYRNAKRRKAHAKMRKIVADAHRLEYEVCSDEHRALQLETRLIQQHRPRWNRAGAFHFLYPMIGVRVSGSELFVCYTTLPGTYPGFSFHGAFRSRYRTREGFFALATLLRTLGHPYSLPELRKQGFPQNSRRTGYVYGYRQVPPDWIGQLDAFFKGDYFAAVQELSLRLLDHPSAVRNSRETEEHLKSILRFWKHEVQALRKARLHSSFTAYPVPQADRDLLFIALRFPAGPSAPPPVPASPREAAPAG